jgi:rhodanese-related sulfurtransferase
MTDNYMKIFNFLSSLSLILLIFISCGRNQSTEKTNNSAEASVEVAKKAGPLVIGQETRMLLEYLSENGDYVNSRDFPSFIKASIVNESLDGNIHIIDIRNKSDFEAGHIKGSVNKSFNDLPSYLESDIRPFEYERIIIVCSSGQKAAYTTSLLRLMGYGNVYAMRWGMSGWDKESAKKAWMKGVSSEYEDRLESMVNENPQAKGMPELETGGTSPEEVASKRFEKIFSEDLNKMMLSAEEVFADPSSYYIINYDRRDKYEDAHIPGAYRYKPGATLSFVDEMATIPTDKPIVVYCGTGHNSAFVTAYLRLFAYDAHTLRFGNNGFMYEKMIRDKIRLSWLPFTEEEIENYPTVK